MCFEGYPYGLSGHPGVLGQTGIPNLEEMLRQYTDDEWGIIGSKYILKVQQEKEGKLYIYIQPSNRSRDRLNFILEGNKLTQI